MQNKFFDEFELLFKGIDVRNFDEEQKRDLFHIVEFFKQKDTLRRKADRGNLDGNDLDLIYEVVTVLSKCLSFVEELKKLNQRNVTSDHYDF